MSAQHQATQDACPPTPVVTCDLCEWPMALPEICRERGSILGLLVCTACIEENLEARNHGLV